MGIVYTTDMKKFEPRHYTLNIEPKGDHLEVTIPELGVTIETKPGQTSDGDAFDAAHDCIERAVLKRDAQYTPAPVAQSRV
jgi:ribosome-associated translation inhibitor RaiA